MFSVLKKDRWSPYAVGFWMAVLGISAYVFFGKILGASGLFVKAAAGMWYVISPSHLLSNKYFSETLTSSPFVNYYLTLAGGVFLGSWIAGKLSGGSKTILVPSIWQNRFGSSRAFRHIFAFIGGMFVIIGARLAGGCTSGLGISGGMQLSATALSFMGALFATAVPTALLLYRKKG